MLCEDQGQKLRSVAKVGGFEPGECIVESQQTTLRRPVEQPDRVNYGKSLAVCQSNCCTVIHQDKTDTKRIGQCNSGALTFVEISQQCDDFIACESIRLHRYIIGNCGGFSEMVGLPMGDNWVNDGLAIGRQWDAKPAGIVFDTD